MFTLKNEFMKKRRLLSAENKHSFVSLRGSLVKMMALFAVCLLAIESGFAQTQAITGVVTETNGTPIIGANVMVKGTTVGTITGANGEFSINAAPNATLEISFIGYKTKEVQAVAGSPMKIELETDAQQIQDVVVVGYGTTKKESLTAAITNITAEDITTTTHSSLAQALQGKMSGLQIRQQSGEPGSTNTTINIRGFGEPMYIIDGVKRDGSAEFQTLNPNDIESISLLKDASAAIYGIGAANGVVIVTTKKGTKGRPKFTYNGVFGVQQPTDVPRMANAKEYTEMWNEYMLYSTGSTAWTQEEMAAYAAGPSTDWYDATMRKFSTQTNHNFSVSGGDDNTTYYVSAGYYRETSVLRSEDQKYERYNFQSNLTTKLGKTVTADLNLKGIYRTNDKPGGDWFTTFKGTRLALPIDQPYANNNPDYPAQVGGADYLNPMAMSQKELSGWNQENNRSTQATVGVTWEVPWVKGLKVRGQAGYDNWGNTYKYVNKSYKLYAYDAANDTYSSITKNSPAKIGNTWRNHQRINLQAQLSYNRTFAEDHNVGAMIGYEQERYVMDEASLSREYDFFTNPQINQASATVQTANGTNNETRAMSMIGRFNYDFRSKYLVEFAFRYSGSYRYAPSQRWGFFPVVSGGWRISEEGFIKNNVSWLTNLKLRASWGQLGTDAGDPYQYIPAYSLSGGGFYEFVNGKPTDGAVAPALVNERLSWYTSTTTDIGIDIGLFNKIDFEFDWYNRDTEGILSNPIVSLPNTFGATLPQENLNSERVKGFDMSIGYNDRWGDWTFGVKANFNFSRGMYQYTERSPYTSSWDKWKNGNTYRYNNIGWGFTLGDRFQNWEDISTSIPQNGNQGNTGTDLSRTYELPGDYKIVDVNGNGIIDDNDQLPMFWSKQNSGDRTQPANPSVFYGITLQAGWKGFDLSLLFQGAAKNSLRYYEVYGEMFAFNANTPAYFYDRWHLKDPYDPAGIYGEWVAGEWPATRKNTSYSSALGKETALWRRDGSYFRFKNAELGYTIPSRITKNWGIDNVRFYINAHNIFTICDPFIKAFDPEKIEGDFGVGFNYPLMRSYNIGVNITF